jgi:large subunit ribosomal protein L18
MYTMKDRKEARAKARRRIRARVQGVADKPRLAVHRSLKHIYAQAIDDESGRTLAAASTLDPECRQQLKSGGGDIGAAKIVGTAIAARLLAKGVNIVVFDRGGFRYQGRVKALADAARAGGLQF